LRYDAAMIQCIEDEQCYYVVKYSREKKIALSGFNESDVVEFSRLSGIPLIYYPSISFANGDTYHAPMIRSVLNWAKKHPRMAKEDGLRYFIEAFQEDGTFKPLPDDEYTGF
jgi:hypothetical protein